MASTTVCSSLDIPPSYAVNVVRAILTWLTLASRSSLSPQACRSRCNHIQPASSHFPLPFPTVLKVLSTIPGLRSRPVHHANKTHKHHSPPVAVAHGGAQARRPATWADSGGAVRLVLLTSALAERYSSHSPPTHHPTPAVVHRVCALLCQYPFAAPQLGRH
jgi:hypothetical protein